METSHNVSSLNVAAEKYFRQPDEVLLQEVMESASGLIRYYSRLYGNVCDHEDLFQTGSLGLMKALKNYDSNRGATFVTYASHCIMGEIRHMVRKQASYYRPGCIAELQFKVDKIIEEYMKFHQDVPAISYIAEKINVTEDSVSEVMKAGLISFEEIDSSKIHSLTYETFRLPIEDKLTLFQAMKKLTEIQKRVIYLLFYQNLSQQQVADRIGINQKKVSRIREATLKNIREHLREDSTN